MIDATYIESLIVKNDIPIKSNAKRDKNNICLLLVLYTLQGLPLGFSLAMPILLQSMNGSFNHQATFSLAVWPFSLKLLWAPLVDSLYVQKWGRRKSWLIPVQYFLGVLFIITGFFINKWLVVDEKLQIYPITIMFFILNFLAATQDIIVDGWALTLLKKENLCYAAMCNSAGQNLGMFLGYAMLIILVSETFWNRWWRTLPVKGGLITLQEYFYIWGVMFIVCTTLVAVLKSEKNNVTESNTGLSIIKTYKSLFSIMKLPNIKVLAIILLTIKISFSSIDATYKLKLIAGGFNKDEVAIIEFLFAPLSISLPILITRFISKEKPLQSNFNIIPYRLLVGIIITVVIYFTPHFLSQEKLFINIYKATVVLLYILYQFMVYSMVLTSIAFYANISDPKIGGTNMTLLTTVSNLGAAGSKTGALWLLEFLTFNKCSIDSTNSCSTKQEKDVCSSSGGKCLVFIDGFYVETILCTIYGVIWYFIFRKSINYLQSKNIDEWHVEMKIKETL